jgi:hypothetical protein
MRFYKFRAVGKDLVEDHALDALLTCIIHEGAAIAVLG